MAMAGKVFFTPFLLTFTVVLVVFINIYYLLCKKLDPHESAKAAKPGPTPTPTHLDG